jgi:hypothetical protein
MPLPNQSHTDIIRRINLTLEGPVAEVMAQLVPELKKLPRRGVLEHVLDDPDLLDRCFKAFRANTDRFKALLVDEQNVPVDEADALLACGRSLDDVVAMVVRTHAKRHFRKSLDGENRSLKGGAPKARAKPQGLFGRLARLFAKAEAQKTQKRTRAEVLYDAFQEHLRHDWQVPLVEEYSKLSPQLVRKLGSRILDYKVPEDIRRLKDSPDELPVPSTLPESIPSFLGTATGRADMAKAMDKGTEKPAAPAAAVSGTERKEPVHEVKPLTPAAKPAASDRRARLSDVLTPDQKRLRAAAFTMTLLDPEVRAALPNADQTVRITGLLAEMGGLSAKMLVGELGLRTDQLAVMAITLFDLLGEDTFRKTFGVPGNLDAVGKFVERAKAAGIDQEAPLAKISDFIKTAFAGVKKPAANQAVVI